MSIKLKEENPVYDYVVKLKERMEREGLDPSKLGSFICFNRIGSVLLEHKSLSHVDQQNEELLAVIGGRRLPSLVSNKAENYYRSLVGIEQKLLPAHIKNEIEPLREINEFSYNDDLLCYVIERFGELSSMLERDIYGDKLSAQGLSLNKPSHGRHDAPRVKWVMLTCLIVVCIAILYWATVIR
jgi:hypothetical protein